MVLIEKQGVSRKVNEKRLQMWIGKGFKVVEPPKPKAPVVEVKKEKKTDK